MRIRSLLFLLVLAAGNSLFGQNERAPNTGIDAAALYQQACASCHGVSMQGAQASPLRKENWVYALDREGMYRTIMFGIVNTEMIA